MALRIAAIKHNCLKKKKKRIQEGRIPSLGDSPDPRIEPGSLGLQANSLPSESLGKPDKNKPTKSADCLNHRQVVLN